VYIEALEFADFRNYQSLSFTPAPSLNLLTGPNAQGKSNLLEGLGVLLVGRSFRGAKAVDLPRWGALHATIAGELHRQETRRSLRRVVSARDDGAWAVGGDGCAWARAIPFSWTDLNIVTGGPLGRRNFLDGFAIKIYPAYAATHQRYRHVLARRNHVLQRRPPGRDLLAEIEPWSEQLIELGIEILARRRQGTAAIRAEVRKIYPILGGRGQLDVEYRSSLAEAPAPEAFRAALASRFGEEVRRGQTLVGPHRDDLLLTLDGRDLRVFGSRGQQRLVALTLRLAEAGPVEEAVGSPPVLLLDDALSELDPGVQERVIEHVARAGQVFLTSADPALPDVARARWWEVRGGAVTDASFAAVRGAA
jgi:DNA replication and repair protein RecF